MKTYYIRNILLLLCIIGLLMQFSCKKEDEDLVAPRLFRPIANVDNSIDNALIVYWKSIEGAKYYQAEISRDSIFQTIDKTITIDPDTVNIIYENTSYAYIKFTDLLAAQDYFIRVRAIHSDPLINSEYFEFEATTLSIFVKPTSNEILDFAFKAKWDVRGLPLSKVIVKLAESDSLISVLEVNDDENKNGVKLVDGLKGSTEYSVFLYSGETMRGKGTVTTQASIQGNIIDLRSIQLYDSVSQGDTVLYDTISKVPSGSIVLLKRGRTYRFPTSTEITGSITVMSGYDFITDLAQLDLEGNPFSVRANSNIDEIIFRDVSMNSTFGGSSYVFFTDSCTINKIEFVNIRSHGHRGFFRLTNQAVVNTLTINNCVIDSLREFGITHMSGENCSIGAINIKNSTFYYVVRPFFNSSTAVTASNTLTIENCTFFNTPDNGRFFFDYSGGTQVTIKNCIFGQTKQLLSAGTSPLGYKLNTVTLTIQGSYKTSDFVTASEALPDLIPYTNTSFDLFTDPDNHNFKIKDSGFAGKSAAGDPRWR
ncbi:MAG: DUF5123 domain-containing protein [Bacteroidales bacterium]